MPVAIAEDDIAREAARLAALLLVAAATMTDLAEKLVQEFGEEEG